MTKKHCHACPLKTCSSSCICTPQQLSSALVCDQSRKYQSAQNSNNKPHNHSYPIKFKDSLQAVPKFSGEGSDNIITFISEIDKAFSSQPEIWSENMKIQGCKTKLEGVALRLAYSSMSKHTTWQQMKKDLLTIFSPNSCVELLILKLYQMEKAINQDWIHYYADIKELCFSISYLDPTFDVEKQTILALFGSADNVLQNQIREARAERKCSSIEILRLILDNKFSKSQDYGSNKKEQLNECLIQKCNKSYTCQENYSHLENINQNHLQSYTEKDSFFQPQGGKFAPNLQFNYMSTRFQSLGEAMMPLPCIRCREWGHYENTCNGPGKNHSSGKRYPPTYCFKCQKWCWHSSTSQYCPTKFQ